MYFDVRVKAGACHPVCCSVYVTVDSVTHRHRNRPSGERSGQLIKADPVICCQQQALWWRSSAAEGETLHIGGMARHSLEDLRPQFNEANT